MIAADARSYIFPTLRAATAPPVAPEPSDLRNRELIDEAIARGYSDGLVRGRADAELQAKALFENARGEGLEAGRAAGAVEIRRTLSALTDALEKLDDERKVVVREAESFCVDLSLAMVSRLAAEDSVRADFVVRAIKDALTNLAPEPPRTIFLNPADLSIIGDKLEGLPLSADEHLAPGHTRIDAGRLFVGGGIDEAFAQIKTSILSVRERRLGGTYR